MHKAAYSWRGVVAWFMASLLRNCYTVFRPTRNRRLLTDRQKICHRWLCPRFLLLCTISWTSVQGGVWTNTWNMTVFIYTFWEFTYSSDRWTDFHDRWLKRDGLVEERAFWVFIDIAPHHCISNRPKPPNFGGVNQGVFKPHNSTCIHHPCF